VDRRVNRVQRVLKDLKVSLVFRVLPEKLDLRDLPESGVLRAKLARRVPKAL
jgi:hypothetical protein